PLQSVGVLSTMPTVIRMVHTAGFCGCMANMIAAAMTSMVSDNLTARWCRRGMAGVSWECGCGGNQSCGRFLQKWRETKSENLGKHLGASFLHRNLVVGWAEHGCLPT